MEEFCAEDLKALYKPATDSTKEDNGKVTIIGGSGLFHGAPLLALKTASRIVDMVFFTSPEPSVGKVVEKMKSQLGSFIWVPWSDKEEYIQKSDAILIGPGLMRYHSEKNHQCKNHRICDQIGEKTKQLTHQLLQKFPQKQWVIDAGSLQVMEAQFIPKNAILTPNKKEFKMLFGRQPTKGAATELAKKYQCIIVLKGVEMIVCSPKKCVVVKGGNAGLTKGGTGDVLAGLATALVAKNPPLLAACAASYIVKKAADELYKKVGFTYNADDLAEKVPEVLGEYFR
ncbi:NAD(P)H-hydrate dehydratase [Patescibacteria group bacterium]|nr:NAD(P)H-hydrate dehydratase [Patescibacteria group bacterium]